MTLSKPKIYCKKNGLLKTLSFASLFILMLYMPSVAYSTHNLAGQITAKRTSANRYLLTITTYSDPAPAGVDRCRANLEIWNCSGQLITKLNDIPRANGAAYLGGDPDCQNTFRGEVVYTSVKRNTYNIEFIFPGPGCYELRYFDPNRREDVVNMNDPGGTTFYLETHLFIPNPILGRNTPPVLLNEPLDEACTNKLWTHNPGGQDAEGDSLAYSLLPSMQYDPQNGIATPRAVNSYRWPDDASFGVASFTIDNRTGFITWDAPRQPGAYNVAFKVEEFRNGIPFGYVIRDMVIFVKPCDNNPPVIEAMNDTCVIAGDTMRFTYKVYDPDFEDSVYLEFNNGALGANGPFNPRISNPGTIGGKVVDPEASVSPWPYSGLPVATWNGVATIDTILGTVTWVTECGNIRSQFYQVDLFAHDNFSYYGNPAMLTANKLVTISVIPPRPTGLTATKSPGQIALKWNKSSCTNVVGYNIYRKIGSSGFSQDSVCCDVSPKDMGYDLVAYNRGPDSITFVDGLEDVTKFQGEEICYVVTAMFEDDDDGFDPDIESCGIEACVKIENDNLLMTNDSVTVTDAANGVIFLAWSKPDSIDSFFEGPFTYSLFRANHNQYPIVEIASGLDFDTDTTYTDILLNTEIRGYNYRVEVVNKDGAIIFTSEKENVASSIFLKTQGGNGTISLSWTEYVSWQNTDYEIWRSVNGGVFNLLTTVAGGGGNTHNYQDSGLDPDLPYCYFVRSEGSHNRNGIKDPLRNDSEEKCDFARDDQPPCTPTVTASGDCDAKVHQVRIVKNTDNCADETEKITVLFAERVEGPYLPVAILDYADFASDTTLFFPISGGALTFAGCYAVTATDRFGNVSPLSATFCIDFCPGLEMGNVFTPNGDQINDIFIPVMHRDVRLVKFIIYDRWGRTMHQTSNEISRLWDGKIQSSGKDAASGTYYYTIEYDELGLRENTRKAAKGWVMLLR